MVLEKTLESPVDCREIQPVHPRGDPSWIFIGRTDAEAEAPILWPPDVKNWLTGKEFDAGKIEGKRRRGWQRMRELDEMTDLMDMSLSKLWEAWRVAIHRVTKSQTRLSDWTELISPKLQFNRKMCNHFLKSRCISELSCNFLKNTNAQVLFFFSKLQICF